MSSNKINRNKWKAAATSLALIVGIAFAISPGAGATESDTYVPVITGDLEVEATAPLEAGVSVTFSGSGFSADSTVNFSMFGSENGVMVAALPLVSDGNGELRHSITIADNVVRGPYSVSMQGIADDGAVVTLSAQVFIDGEEAPATTVTLDATGDTGNGTETSEPDSVTASGDTSSGDAFSGSATTEVSQSDGDATSDRIDDALRGSDDSGGGSAVVWLVVALVVLGLGAAGYEIRRRSTKI